MAETNSGADLKVPNVYRTVTAGDLRTESGVTARCACRLIVMNGEDLTSATVGQTAVFQGPDAQDVTVTVGAGQTLELCGHFAVLGTLGSDITVIAGWIDDGTFEKNA